MDKNEAIKIAERYLYFVGKTYHVEKVLLFGSFAKETNHISSDIDLAIIFKSIDDLIERQIELFQMRSEVI